MRHTRGRVVEVTTLADLDRRLAAGARDLAGWHLQGVDLRDRGRALRAVDVAGALFLGCELTPDDDADVRARGAIVFPTVPDVPVDTYRAELYAPEELYDSTPYESCLDARVYGWSQQPPTPDVLLAQTLHDHAVDAALGRWREARHREGRRLVGVMGGHALRRGEREYAEAARLGHLLGRTHVVATGGGPGAMEAANLGASLADRPVSDLDAAIGQLAAVPSYTPDIGAWARAAFAVRERFGPARASLGIPTWHYGHEPPNPFPTAIAKYFGNATREAILLEVCDAGIVFLPGAAGTVQEVFQDACENYYADESSAAPMVLVGVHHWTRDLPAWPLLRALAERAGPHMRVELVDSAEEAAALLAP